MNDAGSHASLQGTGLMLGMMLVLACCIAAGGVTVARRDTEQRRERDRQALHVLTNAMQAEARELEAVYEQHLKTTATRLAPLMRDTETARQTAQNVEGIRRVSWLFWKKASPETHLNLGLPADPPLPEPTIEKAQEGLPRPRVLLDSKRLFADVGGQNSGWIDEPGKPLMFYAQTLATAVVLTIDRPAVETAMSGYFQAWLRQAFQPVVPLGGPDAVLDARGRVLGSAGKPPASRPDMIAPIVSRFGVWQVVSWDERLLRTTYHLPTIAGAFTLALLVAGCGIGMSVQQRRAARVARQRVSFVNRVSHELRSPMTNILLNLDVIEDAVPERVRGRLALVREEAARLSRLVENVLTFSRREQGSFHLHHTRCRPAAVVDDVVRQFEPALQRRGIQVKRSHEGEAGEAMLDADALAQITANLLSNVEKYAPDADVSVRSVQRAGTFSLTVTDGGPGIAAGGAERIFEPFWRADDRVQAGVSGAGLGLSIARDLARLMGGSLTLLTTDPGAAFELRLPLVPPHDAPFPDDGRRNTA